MSLKLLNKKIIFLAFIFIFIFIFSLFIFNNTKKEKIINKLEIKSAIIKVEIANSPSEYYLGLSNRDFLEKDSGMLFIFPSEDRRAFVMRNMNFPLDIIFIKGDKVVYVCKNLPPNSDEQEFFCYSDFLVDKVLEVNAGFCEDYNILIGDEVKFFNI